MWTQNAKINQYLFWSIPVIVLLMTVLLVFLVIQFQDGYSSPNLGSYGRRFGDIYAVNIRANDGYFGGDTGDYNGIIICETPNPNPIHDKLGIKYAILSYTGSPSSLPNYGYLTLRKNDFYSVTVTPDLDNGTSNGVNVELPWQSGKLVNNMIVTDWNEAVYTGFYRSEANAKNMPSGETNAAAGYVLL